MFPQLILLTILRFTNNLVNFIDFIFSISKNDEKFLETMEFLNNNKLYKNRKWMHDLGVFTSNLDYKDEDDYEYSPLHFITSKKKYKLRQLFMIGGYDNFNYTNILFKYLKFEIGYHYSYDDDIYNMFYDETYYSSQASKKNNYIYGFTEAIHFFMSEDIKQFYNLTLKKLKNKFDSNVEEDIKLKKIIKKLNLKFKTLFQTDECYKDFMNVFQYKDNNYTYIDFYTHSILSNVNIKYDIKHVPDLYLKTKYNNYNYFVNITEYYSDDMELTLSHSDNIKYTNNSEDDYNKEDVYLSNKKHKKPYTKFPKKEKRGKYSSTRLCKKHYKQYLKHNIDFKVN